MQILGVILTSLLSVVALFVITKIMGHKQVSQLDFFDYVSGITIGSIGAELATELKSPEKPLIALIVYGIVSVLLNFFTNKIPASRKYINGSPTILMSGGTLYRRNLKKAKLDLSEFMLLCRDKGYFDLDEIECAVFEYNGKLSILPKSDSRPTTPKDFDLAPKDAAIGVEIIMDGRVLKKNLKAIGRDERWLEKELTECKIGGTGDVFLAVYQREKDELKIYKTEDG